MPFANITLVASAGQVNFAFPFPYLDQEHIFVERDGVNEPDFSFLNASTVTLDDPADEDSLILIHRETPIDEPFVDYVNGSVLGETDLDTTTLQILYAQQEQFDDLENSIHANAVLQWDALNRRIINVGAPVDDTDAATKGFADTVLADAQADADAAAASAAASAASAVSASASATTATTQAGLATTARVAAETAETNAETAETNASLSAANADTSETNADTFATNAQNSATNAFTSAGNAAASEGAAAASASAAAQSATDADASAIEAALQAAKLQGTSTTSVAIATGPKAFTTQEDKYFDEGVWLLITSDANETNYMHGSVTSYVTDTVTMEVTNVGGSGTFADWTLRVSGTRGAAGTPGAGSSIIFSAEGVNSGTRPEGNFIEGDNITLTLVDNGVDDRVDITIEADLAEHLAEGDPHPQYTTAAELTAGVDGGIATHAAAADPHTGYQKESEKDAANGYAGLTAGAKIKDDVVVTASITNANVTTAKIADANVTKAKIENVATSKLLGHGDGAAGAPEEITLGTNLSMSGTTLNATGGSGGDSLTYEFW